MDEKYRTIRHCSRPHSTAHPPMSQWDRAAQFAPFSALSGHAEGATETARVTQSRRELSDDAIAALNARLQRAETQLSSQPQLSITYFVPDPRKDGGCYHTVIGILKKIDHHRRVVMFINRIEIPIDEIISIEGELFYDIEE